MNVRYCTLKYNKLTLMSDIEHYSFSDAARSRATFGARLGAAADDVGIQEPPAYSAEGEVTATPQGSLGQVPEDPSESGRGIPPPPPLGNPSASALGLAQDSVWGGIAGDHSISGVQQASARSVGHYSVASASQYGNAAGRAPQGQPMDPSALGRHRFSGAASVGSSSVGGGFSAGGVPNQVNIGTTGVGVIPPGGGVPGFVPGVMGAVAPRHNVPQGHRQVVMGQQFFGPRGPSDNRLLFTATADITDVEISQTQGVLVSKEDRQPGTKEFSYIMTWAIEGISPKLGVPTYS